MALLSGHDVKRIYYGIGLPVEKHNAKSKESAGLVDFILGVDAGKSIVVLYDHKGISF